MNTHAILQIVVMALGTIFLRTSPFVFFPEGKPIPKILLQLSKVLPFAVMGMLVVYCMKDVTLFSFPFALPEIISSILVIVSYLWKRNTCISIACGTICYMLLLQWL